MLCDACKHPLPRSDLLPTITQTKQLRELLRSGSLPPDPSHYRGQITTAAAAVAQYDIHIQRLQETLRGLLADRSELQEYADGLRAAISPVRSLPPEILGKIFTPFSGSEESRSSNEELRVLAKSELLELSKVCSYWYRVVVGTPRLWSDIAVNLDWWPEDLSKQTPFRNLLTTSIERGGKQPLELTLRPASQETGHYGPAYTLLADHCQRWQHLSLFGPSASLGHLSCIKGNLDALETLVFQSWGEETSSDLFEIAPRLTTVSLQLENSQFCPKLPWDQLCSVVCIELDIEDIPYITASLQKVSHPDAVFEIRRFHTVTNAIWTDIPAVTSTVSSLLVEVCPHTDPSRSNICLGRIFSCLTLPRLRKLFFVCGGLYKNRMPWPMNQFESLSSRSSFCNTLRVLEIPEVTITEDELIRSVTTLGSLERLVISDQRKYDGLPEHVLITDALLLRLTHTSGSQLIPNLTHFTCTTFFKFSANIYFDFVVSRIRRLASDKVPFQCGLCHFQETAYDFDLDVQEKLLELVEKRELEFSIREATWRMSRYVRF
ncbi:hypothetical protein C8R43DRAFT_1112164 [Mycena crocata]|nr:hypothetical protein C8R43DRAFT_1112164 [Mycena crocata]